jgi:hypothetical protein
MNRAHLICRLISLVLAFVAIYIGASAVAAYGDVLISTVLAIAGGCTAFSALRWWHRREVFDFDVDG